jgi:hypothetical protein
MKEIMEILLGLIKMMRENNGEKNRFIFGEDHMMFHRQAEKALRILQKGFYLILMRSSCQD